MTGSGSLLLPLGRAQASQPVSSGGILERQVSLPIPCPKLGNGTSRATLELNIWGALSPSRFIVMCERAKISRAKNLALSPDHLPQRPKFPAASESQIPPSY